MQCLWSQQGHSYSSAVSPEMEVVVYERTEAEVCMYMQTKRRPFVLPGLPPLQWQCIADSGAIQYLRQNFQLNTSIRQLPHGRSQTFIKLATHQSATTLLGSSIETKWPRS